MTNKVWLGALGGALGGLVMKTVVEILDPHSFGLSSRTDADTAHAIWGRMGWAALSDERARQIGAGMHYGFAVLAGIAYTGLGDRYPVIQAGRGSAFGAALWLTGDEIAVSASGLEDPWKTPAFSHASALGAHIAFGLVLDFVQDVRTNA